MATLKGSFGQTLRVIPILYWSRHYDRFDLIKDTTLSTSFCSLATFAATLRFENQPTRTLCREDGRLSRMTQVHDLAVLGGGPAGYATALRAAQLGLDVTLVEERKLGSTCLHRGCVPTKAWLQAAKTRTTVAKADRLGIGAILTGVDAAKVRDFADSLVSGLHRGLTGLIRLWVLTQSSC